MVPLRTQAIQKLHKAAKMLAQAGYINEMVNLAAKESELIQGRAGYEDDDENWEIFNCSVCGDTHYASVHVKKPKEHNYQYAMEIDLCMHWSQAPLWDRICAGFRAFWTIVRGEIETHDVMIARNDLTRLTDVFRIMIREEERKT